MNRRSFFGLFPAAALLGISPAFLKKALARDFHYISFPHPHEHRWITTWFWSDRSGQWWKQRDGGEVEKTFPWASK